MIEDFCGTQGHVQFIDIRPAMLNAQGRPRRELFRFDGLHMNAQGYALWTSIIKPILLGRFAPAPAQASSSVPKSLSFHP